MVPWPFYLLCSLSEKKRGGGTKRRHTERDERKRKRVSALHSVCDLHRGVCQWIPCLHLRGGVFLGWNLRDEAGGSLFDPCAVAPPPTHCLPLVPPSHRIPGPGGRDWLCFSPSAAETWYQESSLSSSFIVPSQVRLFTSFIYCSPALPPPALFALTNHK